MADANTERPCEVQDAVDILPISVPKRMLTVGEAKGRSRVGLERPPVSGRLRMSRVTQRPFGEPDERP